MTATIGRAKLHVMIQTYHLKGGGTLEASSPAEIIDKLRAMSYNPETSREEFMTKTADACQVQTGAVISTWDDESFVEDLLSNGFISIQEQRH